MEKTNYYQYKVYGLQVNSEIEITEFIIDDLPSSELDIINIRYGVMNQEIQSLVKEGMKSYMSHENIWFHINDIATYQITNGNLITVQSCENCDMQLMKIFIMCSCLGFIMIQRNKVAIHGGTIVMGDQAVVITGDRGAGKSTLTTALRQKGYKFLADDVAATIFRDIPLVQCGFPYQKLCEDAMDNLGYDKTSFTSFEGDGKVKYIVPAIEDFQQEDTSLTAICEVVASDVEQVEIESVKGQEKLKYILKNVYRSEFLPLLGIAPEYFKQCVQIAKSVNFYRVKRPKEGFTVDEQIKCIEQLMLIQKGGVQHETMESA